MPLAENKLDSEIWQELGNHGARITGLEASEIQHQQWQVNHRAETLGLIKELKTDFFEIIKPLAADVNAMKGYLKYGMGYGMGVGGTLLILLELWRALHGSN